MGSHLHNFLRTKSTEIEQIAFKRSYFDDDFGLHGFVKSCDVIVHVAAMNRHEDGGVLYDTNVGLVQKLVDACEATKSKPRIIFSSSTQEDIDSPYGWSKRDGRKIFEEWATCNAGQITSLIIPNVFGPFGRPFHNSVIATFSKQVVQGEEPEIIKDGSISLIYINDLLEIFYKEILSEHSEATRYHVVRGTASRTVSEILTLLKCFKRQYFDNGQVPKLRLISFELALFNTFTSFIPRGYFPRKFTMHSDDRGSFVEIMRTGSGGQTSYSTTLPGVTRGNHYHTRKIERFAVISGRALIQIRKIDSDEVFEYILDGAEPAYVDMPIWHTHNIKNIGSVDLITIFWINEPYDPEDTDTYFVKA